MNMEAYCREYVWVMFIWFLAWEVKTWTLCTTTQQTFPVWKYMFWCWICTHYGYEHARLCLIDMLTMRNLGLSYVSNIWLAISPDLLFCSFWILSLSFYRYCSRLDNKNECIIMVDMQHSQPNTTLYYAEMFLSWGGIMLRNI